MKKISDIINEGNFKDYFVTATVTLKVKAESEGDAGYAADSILQGFDEYESHEIDSVDDKPVHTNESAGGHPFATGDTVADVSLSELREACAKIKHCGDYGVCFIDKEGNVVWTGGDADSPDNGYTGCDEIKDILASVEGVKSVEWADEYYPSGDGWVIVNRD